MQEYGDGPLLVLHNPVRNDATKPKILVTTAICDRNKVSGGLTSLSSNYKMMNFFCECANF